VAAVEAGAAAATGFALAATLIIAIGAQNAFVLRQGLKREHVGLIVAFCAAADALLMIAGVLGAGRALAAAPRLTLALAAAGALFLAFYGLRALHRAWRPTTLLASYQTVNAHSLAVPRWRKLPRSRC
jgi:L-lysine exporter family protein LysE/ArgO